MEVVIRKGVSSTTKGNSCATICFLFYSHFCIDYLHRMQRVYESEIDRMQDTIDHSGSAREIAQATKRKEKLQKQLKECREYDEKISHLALARIELNSDNGVKGHLQPCPG